MFKASLGYHEHTKGPWSGGSGAEFREVRGELRSPQEFLRIPQEHNEKLRNILKKTIEK